MELGGWMGLGGVGGSGAVMGWGEGGGVTYTRNIVLYK